MSDTWGYQDDPSMSWFRRMYGGQGIGYPSQGVLPAEALGTPGPASASVGYGALPGLPTRLSGANPPMGYSGAPMPSRASAPPGSQDGGFSDWFMRNVLGISSAQAETLPPTMTATPDATLPNVAQPTPSGNLPAVRPPVAGPVTPTPPAGQSVAPYQPPLQGEVEGGPGAALTERLNNPATLSQAGNDIWTSLTGHPWTRTPSTAPQGPLGPGGTPSTVTRTDPRQTQPQGMMLPPGGARTGGAAPGERPPPLPPPVSPGLRAPWAPPIPPGVPQGAQAPSIRRGGGGGGGGAGIPGNARAQVPAPGTVTPGEYFATTGNARGASWTPGGFAGPPAQHFQTPLTPMFGPGQWVGGAQPAAPSGGGGRGGQAAAPAPSSGYNVGGIFQNLPNNWFDQSGQGGRVMAAPMQRRRSVNAQAGYYPAGAGYAGGL